MQRLSSRYFLLLSFLILFATVSTTLLINAPAALAQQQQLMLPVVQPVALDGHKVSLPYDLSETTIVIVGFSKASSDATTAWEIPVRTKLAGANVGFYDVAVLASVPSFLHGWVIRSLHSKVPPVLQGRFLPVFADEAAWKQACGYDPKLPDAAYVLIVDHSGSVLWRTHEPYTVQRFDELTARVRQQLLSH